KPKPFKIVLFSFLSFLKNKKYYEVYDYIEDNNSKALFIKLLMFKILGSGHVKLPLNNEGFWKEYETIDKRFLISSGEAKIGRFVLNKYEINLNGDLLKLLAHPLTILNTFILKQYHFT